jgi:hypothetical protein
LQVTDGKKESKAFLEEETKCKNRFCVRVFFSSLTCDFSRYKPLPADGEKGMREADFYRVVQTLGPQHFPFVPRCYGVRNFVVNTAVPQVFFFFFFFFFLSLLLLLSFSRLFSQVSPEGVEVRTKVLPHLVLEDVTAPYDEASVLDVKIGLITYDPNTSDLEKIESQRKKYPHQGEMGYSVAGMRVYNTVTKSYETRNRQWGRALRRHQVSPFCKNLFVDCFALKRHIWCSKRSSGTVSRLKCKLPKMSCLSWSAFVIGC